MKFILVIVLAFFSVKMNAQELNCQVSIITDARLEITSVEKQVLVQLEQAVYDLMNSTQWTKDNFTVEERINCTIQLQIREVPSAGVFKGYMQVQSSRPALNSSYNSTLFNFQDDDITFSYSRNTQLIFAPNQYRNNLSSLMAFYAYYIIGMDYDSFSNKGGTKYFQKAQQVVSNAQSSGAPGWASSQKGKRNRYWLVDNILNELFSPLRECNYLYHRQGIDKLYENKVAGRKAIYNALNKLLRVTSTRPNSLNVLNFVQSKRQELISLYEDAEPREKNNIVNLLKRIDPTSSQKYQAILN